MTAQVTPAEKIARFRDLHEADDLFVMPNPWDLGSARLLAHLGFPALATTSSGHAASLGRLDQHVTRQEMLDHAARMAAGVAVPLNVDSERCFGDTPAEVAETVRAIVETGAAGCSIEDYEPVSGAIDPIDVAAERVAAAAEAAHAGPLPILMTARAEGHLYGVDDLDETITRLRRFRDAGADVVYAPGLSELEDIRRVVEVGTPVNVLAWPTGPSVVELASVGVRRVSTGGALAWAALGAVAAAGRELLSPGPPATPDRPSLTATAPRSPESRAVSLCNHLW
jgi:2-methylisocitrate lyase-like PEP mutase family enzyme